MRFGDLATMLERKGLCGRREWKRQIKAEYILPVGLKLSHLLLSGSDSLGWAKERMRGCTEGSN